jgi:hypothetical protein
MKKCAPCLRHSPCSLLLLGAVLSGCGNGSSGASEGGAADAPADSVCSPEAVTPSDAGACNDCILAMCESPLMQCNADCTCGTTVNGVNACIASQPAPAADAAAGPLGQLGALLPGGGTGFLTCFLPYLGGGGGGLAGLLGGGPASSGGGPTAPSSATTGLLTCTLMGCGMQCFGGRVPEGGVDGGPREATTSDGPEESAAAPEASPEPLPEAGPEGAGDDGSSDATADASEGG